MSKLKVGDKVRVVKVYPGDEVWLEVGLEGVAEEVDDGDVSYRVRYSNGKTSWVYEDQLELIEPKEEELVFEPDVDLINRVAKLEERLEKLELLNPTKGVVFTPEQIEVIINLRK